MKKKKKIIQSMFTLLLFNSLVVLCGCDMSRQANVASSTTDSTEPEKVLEELAKDIDGNGVEDKVEIISLNDDVETNMRVYLNEDDIFEFEDSNVRLMGIGSFEYLDLDADNVDEIFMKTDTNANSRPYTEVVCLKQIEGKWNQMDLPKNEEGYNEIPFTITRGKDELEFIISSDDTDQIIHYDASRYFIDDKSADNSSIQAYRANNYKEGDEVGFISAWGIHDAKTGTYEGRNCIIVNQGIEGPYGHSLGEINIYLAFNKEGKADILNVEYIEN